MKALPVLFICLTLIGCDDSPDTTATPPPVNDCLKTWLNPSEHIHPNTDIFELSKKDNGTSLYFQYGDNTTVTIPYTQTDLLHQMALLVEAGIFVQVANLINVGDINLSGYFRDEVHVDTRSPPMGIHTRQANGGMYRLTEKGKQWFILDKDDQGFYVCIGEERVVSTEERVATDGSVIRETHYELVNTPDWYKGELVNAIPKIKNEIDSNMHGSLVSTSRAIQLKPAPSFED